MPDQYSKHGFDTLLGCGRASAPDVTKCSLSTSVNIDRLTMVDNTSAVGNDSRP